jgi:hypothetical protein
MSHYNNINDIHTFTQALINDTSGKIGGEYKTNAKLQTILTSIYNNPDEFLNYFEKINTNDYIDISTIRASIDRVKNDISGRPKDFLAAIAIWFQVHH